MMLTDFFIPSPCGDMPVIHLSKGWFVINKPSGISVHNAPGADVYSCIKSALVEQSELSAALGVDESSGIHPVNRIDKETSGLMIISVHAKLSGQLADQMSGDHATKTYMAILHGKLQTPADNGWATWSWPITRQGGGRNCPAGTGDRVRTITRVRAIRNTAHYTLAEIQLITGRKHQIRRHAKLAGHPVVGDTRYCSSRALRFVKNNAGFDRMALHSYSVALSPPGAPGVVSISTGDLPQEMRHLLDNDSQTH